MRDWVAIGLGLLAIAGTMALANGCGRRDAGQEQLVALDPAEKTALESAAAALADAASKGDVAVLNTAVNPRLPKREMDAVRATVAGLKGKEALKVASSAGTAGGGAVVTLDGGGRSRTWRFDKVDGAWKLSGT